MRLCDCASSPLESPRNGEAISLTPATKMLANWVGLFSPSNLNPMGINPLRDMLNKQVDFEQLRRMSPFQLFVGATHVNTGKLRLFREHELTVDMVLASACLPKIHHTVAINGEPYWDGGFSANVLQRSETKVLAYTPFLAMLMEQGRAQAKNWLAAHAASVGKCSSVDLTQWLG